MTFKVLETRTSEIGVNCKEFYDKKKTTQLRLDPKAIKHCFIRKMYRFPEKPEGGAGSPGGDGTGLAEDPGSVSTPTKHVRMEIHRNKEC